MMFSSAIATAGVLAFTASIVAADRTTRDRGSAQAATTAAPAARATTGAVQSTAHAATPAAAPQALAKPNDATLPALQEGPVAKVHMTLEDKVVEIAPGVRYRIWAFEADGGAPGPVVHVREGQKVEFTIENGGSIPHSMDFHAARIAPNKAFRDVAPGESFSFEFVAGDPGVYMYHCGTKPVLAHIANGMYGAIVVRPKDLAPADNEYVLVGSEWYLNGDGTTEPASLDMAKAKAMTPDYVTFNGQAAQYVASPLTAEPGDTTRFWVVAAGPTLDVNFHVVGTVFERAWVNGDMSNPQHGVQTVLVPAGGGAVFDVKIDEEGTYPFVSHAFAHVELGQVGILKVGNPKTAMSH